MKILIAGDLKVGENSTFSIDNLNKPIERHDHFLFNLEAPLINGIQTKPISKIGPNLSMHADSLAPLLPYRQKMVVSCANNHMGDFGEEGIYNTLKYLKENHILQVGCGKNRAQASKPLILKESVALLAIAENEFGMASEDKAGANALKIEESIIQVMELTRDGYSVIVYFHGGNEYSPIPNPFIKRLYRSFIDAGAKAVIGNHTHSPQGYESYHQGVIFYSLGNFVFETSPNRYGLKERLKQRVKSIIRKKIPNFWNIGYLVSLEIEQTKVAFTLLPFVYENNQIVLMRERQKEHFLDYLSQLSHIINDKEEYLYLWNTWTKIHSIQIQKKISHFDYAKIHKEKSAFLHFRNQITCESHRELLLNMNALIENHTLESYHHVDKIEFLQNPANFGVL